MLASQRKRKSKALKVRQSCPSFILGKDVVLDRMISFSSKALVGKFFYFKMSKSRLSVWITKEWKPISGYCPRFSLLSNFWIVFHFLFEDDLLKIFAKVWLIDQGVLI